MEPRKIILSADSTCDLPLTLKERFSVHYYPFHIVFREQSYQDNVNIHPQQIFEGYYDNGALPTTGAMSIQEFVAHFTPFVEAGFDVIHLNLGSSISSAHDHACKAAEQLENVYVIDSGNLSTGMGHLIIRAGELIEQGLPAPEVVRQVEALRPHVHMSFVLETMDFLAAGGRCPQVLAHAGKMLSIRPMVLVNNTDASMTVGKVYRGKTEKILRRYVQEMLEANPTVALEHVFVVHTFETDEMAQQIAAYVKELLPVRNVYISQASCTIASHCGPNTLGLAFATKD